MVKTVSLSQSVQTLVKKQTQNLLRKPFDLSTIVPCYEGFLEKHNPLAVMFCLEQSMPEFSPRIVLSQTLDQMTEQVGDNSPLEIFKTLSAHFTNFLSRLASDGTNLLSLHPFNKEITRIVSSETFQKSETFQTMSIPSFISDIYVKFWSSLIDYYTHSQSLENSNVENRVQKTLAKIQKYEKDNWDTFYSLVDAKPKKASSLRSRANLPANQRQQISLKLLTETIDLDTTIERIDPTNQLHGLLTNFQQALKDREAVQNISLLEQYFQNTADLLKLRGYGLTAQRYEELDFQADLLNSLNEVSQRFSEVEDSWEEIVNIAQPKNLTPNQDTEENQIILDEFSIPTLREGEEFIELAEYLTATLNQLHIHYPNHSFKFIINKTHDGEINYEIEYKPNFEEPKTLRLDEGNDVETEKEQLRLKMERIIKELEPQATSRA